MVDKQSIFCTLVVLSLSGCGDDFTYSAGIQTGRLEIREIRSDGSVGFVVPIAGGLNFERTGDSHLDIFPIRLRLSRAGEPDREVTLYSECASACNGSVNCSGKSVIHEKAFLSFTDDGLLNQFISQWTCTFDDGTTFFILS